MEVKTTLNRMRVIMVTHEKDEERMVFSTCLQLVKVYSLEVSTFPNAGRFEVFMININVHSFHPELNVPPCPLHIGLCGYVYVCMYECVMCACVSV